MAEKPLICPGCGVAITWSTLNPRKLRLGCACHSIDFDTSTASADDVAALKIAAEEILRDEHVKAMAIMAALAPAAGVRQ
jgi:hypothetical protein